MPSRCLSAVILITLVAGCGDGGDGGQAPELPDMAPGVFTGTFPCHDCPGIDTTLWLRPDGRFFIRQRYLASEDRDETDTYSLGRWRMAGAEGNVVLESEGPNRGFEREGPDALLLLTDSDLEHRLSRDPGSTPFTSTIRLTGTMHMEAGGAVFTECLTAYVVPVTDGGDFARLRHQYRRVRARAGPVFVEFDGRFHWSDGGAPRSVTIERFGTIRESGECRASTRPRTNTE